MFGITDFMAFCAAMAATIAAITAVYCLALCAFANVVAAKVRAHRTARAGSNVRPAHS